MKNLGFAAIIASGLTAAVLGLAGPAQAAVTDAPATLTSIATGVDHNAWINDIRPEVHVPQVDTSVQQSR